MPIHGPLRIVQRNALVYRRNWRGSVFFSFLQPTLFLVAMGLGVGGMVDVSAAGGALTGGTFLTFLAPGLMAAACMQTAAFESSFSILGKMTWRRNYQAISATPLGVTDIVIGELAWMAVRLSMVASAFGAVLWAFDITPVHRLPAAVAGSVLTGLAFSAPTMAYAATLRTGGNFNALFRFGIMPLFLFSGVFFPVSTLPGPLPSIAAFTPLYHGVELVRGQVLNTSSWAASVGHVAYLAAMLGVGLTAALRTFGRKLRA
jgi:lipooligosaccharide transport system permease protein